MEPLKLGYCGICNVIQIWYRDKKKVVFTQAYAEFSFVLSDGLLYRHGVCTNCIVDLTTEKVETLVGRIKKSWEKEMAGWGTHAQYVHVRALTVKAYDLSEKQVLQKEKVRKDTEFKEHLEETKRQKNIAKELNEELVA